MPTPQSLYVVVNHCLTVSVLLVAMVCHASMPAGYFSPGAIGMTRMPRDAYSSAFSNTVIGGLLD
jgi:hypothetical protein